MADTKLQSRKELAPKFQINYTEPLERDKRILKKAFRKRPQALPPENSKSRDAILVAALKAFAQGGFDGASLPKIAKIAKVAPPLIHYYFGSKEKLWRKTVDHSLGELRRESSAICNATRALAPLDRLRAPSGSG